MDILVYCVAYYATSPGLFRFKRIRFLFNRIFLAFDDLVIFEPFFTFFKFFLPATFVDLVLFGDHFFALSDEPNEIKAKINEKHRIAILFMISS